MEVSEHVLSRPNDTILVLRVIVLAGTQIPRRGDVFGSRISNDEGGARMR